MWKKNLTDQRHIKHLEEIEVDTLEYFVWKRNYHRSYIKMSREIPALVDTSVLCPICTEIEKILFEEGFIELKVNELYKEHSPK